ncbi:MAG TPA: SAM-dependent DNA methyltransferase, partial [Candidatus Altiarchaeales archaeon]|nr:SAM-dependent DNA methyltransferase [Candidatus Altiarchaeales archaeon]
YYTPRYIVNYIVENTVGKLIEGKTPKQITGLKILDPACGSGSFLIGAYHHLLDYHRDWYVKNNPEKHQNEIYQGKGGQWHLTTQEKKRILLNNIYGVDIDDQAVEVTKLNLLLTVLENENQDTLLAQKKLVQERALPDLNKNIKCGNSLIGPDFYNNQTKLLDTEEQLKINAFNWQKEFPFKFDAIIGNPPYIKEYVNSKPFHDIQKTKLGQYYQGKMDIWYVFTCLSIDLLKTGGLHSFIATNNWITNSGASILRKKILSETQFHEFTDFGDYRVFETAGIQTMIYILEKTNRPHKTQVLYKRLTNPKVSAPDVIQFLHDTVTKNYAVSFKATLTDDTGGGASNYLC